MPEDNSYMFVDEDKEDIHKVKPDKTKGRYIDKEISGDVREESLINLVADEDVISKISESIHDRLDMTESPHDITLNNDKIVTKGRGFGVASLVCGIVSLTLFASFINLFASVLSVIFGLIQIRRGSGRWLAVAGILLSVISVILLIVCMNLIVNNQAFVDMMMQNIDAVMSAV